MTILSVVCFSFICYLAVGLPMAVLPTYVKLDLGFSPFVAGLSISAQYVATILNRPQSGRMADILGAKKTVSIGLALCAVSGLSFVAAWTLRAQPYPSLCALLLGRLILGLGESWAGTGVLVWGIARAGAAHTARVITWNGISTYSAIAVGAPLGVALVHWIGLTGMGLFVLAFCGISVGVVLTQPASPPLLGERLPMSRVARAVTPFGLALGAGSIGFGALASFVTLYFAERGWPNPAYALTAFGGCFIVARMVFSNSIVRNGGYRVGLLCLSCEAVGLTVVALAPTAALAMLGAGIAGAGFSLVFPALAVEALTRVPHASRGAALGFYNIFMDAALGFTGPLAGLLVVVAGYRGVYGVSAFVAVAGAATVIVLSARYQTATPEPAPEA